VDQSWTRDCIGDGLLQSGAVDEVHDLDEKHTGRRLPDGLLLACLWMALLLFFLGLFLLRHFGLPVGPDGPVYIWWTRLAGHDGLSAVHRPGVPALALVLQGLGLKLTAALAALECVLGASVGTAAAALVRTKTRSKPTWLLAGVLTGTFAVHLAAGYLANLAFAVLFLAAGVALALGNRRSTTGAAALLGAAGLAHPLFFPLGLLILGLSAALAWRADRREALRVIAAGLGGGAILGVGFLALQAGPGPLAVDTSRDGFLRRAGLSDVLRSAYLDRFVHRWTRYVEWASIPLAIAGLREATGFVGRFLRAWGIVLVAGVAFSLATGFFPADRFITFGYVVPILAALGLVRLWRALAARPVVAITATGALTAAMLAGSWIAWAREAPFASPLEVQRVTTANRLAAAAVPGTPLVFTVNQKGTAVSFLATRAANVIRAGMPPGRIRDVLVSVPTPAPGAPASKERRALSRVTGADVRAAVARKGSSLRLLLTPFDSDPADRTRFTRVSRGVFATTAELTSGSLAEQQHPIDPLLPSSPAGIALATIATFALLSAIGLGWAQAATRRWFLSAALAPAFGAAAAIVAAVALERIGLSIDRTAGAALASALVGAGGYVAWLVVERRPPANTA
jgi:hypothetical protein